MATKKLHQDMTAAEAQRYGALKGTGSTTPEFQVLHAKRAAQAAFAQLEAVEKDVARAPASSYAGLNAYDRDAEMARDAQAVGRGGADAAAARGRLARHNEAAASPARLAAAQADYDRAVDAAAGLAADFERTQKRGELETLRAEMGRTKDTARVRELAAQVDRLEQEIA